MKPGLLADFMFLGVAIIPGTLICNGAIGLALSAFIVLLIAACLCGWMKQVHGDGDETSRDGVRSGRQPYPPPT